MRFCDLTGRPNALVVDSTSSNTAIALFRNQPFFPEMLPASWERRILGYGVLLLGSLSKKTKHHCNKITASVMPLYGLLPQRLWGLSACPGFGAAGKFCEGYFGLTAQRKHNGNRRFPPAPYSKYPLFLGRTWKQQFLHGKYPLLHPLTSFNMGICRRGVRPIPVSSTSRCPFHVTSDAPS